MKISGKITESGSGIPVPFVNIFVSDSKGIQVGSQGTISDFDGKYSITVSNIEYLTFSSLGFESVTRRISGTSDAVINVPMKKKTFGLQEIVIESDRIVPEPAQPVSERKKMILWWHWTLIGLGATALGLVIYAAATVNKK